MGVRPWLEALDRWPSSPVAEITEALRAVSALLRGESVTDSAELFTMSDVTLDEGVQCPCPILVGAVGPAMLRVAARAADGAILSVLSSPEYARWARTQLDEAGGSGSARELVCFANVSISDAGRQPAAELLRADTAFLLKAMGRSALVEPLGIGAELESLLETTGESATELVRALPTRWIEALSIVGTPDDCAERVRAYVEAGVDTLVLAPKPAEDARALVERLPDLLEGVRA
jgi:alkanesulfonate monooxygenase SsuD/methylene tetrahydromethanopterin reductase-like flavin-dependent oxidoreductase (luciferase family)